ncbi:hypothetical protein GCM10022207_89590 [Streptomyces lannensis]|uniref:Uncharacterized protein n=1 Tax=Streptomyces lannensis TaxID=766498 RepID=A0ABP7LU29_9ACTN
MRISTARARHPPHAALLSEGPEACSASTSRDLRSTETKARANPILTGLWLGRESWQACGDAKLRVRVRYTQARLGPQSGAE